MADKKYVTKDSGHRQVFTTGAQRDRQEGKGRYDLLPAAAIKRIADIFERGAIKYADRNWEKGMNLSRYVDSAMRHLFQYLEGRRDEDHLGQAAWNLIACLHTETMIERGLLPQELYDLPTHYVEYDPDDTSTHLPKLDVIHDEGNEDEFEDELEKEDLYEESKPLPKQPPPYHKFAIGDKVRTKTLSLNGVVENYHETLKDCYYVKIPLLSPNTPVFHELELEEVNG